MIAIIGRRNNRFDPFSISYPYENLVLWGGVLRVRAMFFHPIALGCYLLSDRSLRDSGRYGAEEAEGQTGQSSVINRRNSFLTVDPGTLDSIPVPGFWAFVLVSQKE